MDLEDVQFAKPCAVSWGDMVESPNEQVRLCTRCNRNVYNLSQMTRKEGLAFLQKTEGTECVQIWKRKDGTVLTADDCPEVVPPPPSHVSRLGGAPLPRPGEDP